MSSSVAITPREWFAGSWTIVTHYRACLRVPTVLIGAVHDPSLIVVVILDAREFAVRFFVPHDAPPVKSESRLPMKHIRVAL